MNNITELKETTLETAQRHHREMIANMTRLQEALVTVPGARLGDAAGPLRHFFGQGLYIREYLGHKDTIAVTRLHNTTHPFFLMSGEVTILTEKGEVRIRAPHFEMTKAGTKRVIFFHEDTVCMTVHATDKIDTQDIVSDVTSETYKDLPDFAKEYLLESRQ